MSHLYVMAIVPQGCDPATKIAALMERYSEEREVPEYEKPCYCVGRKAKDDAHEAATGTVGSIDSLRDSFHKAYPLPAGKDDFSLDADEDEARRVAWEAHLAPFVEAERRALEAHPDRTAPNPNCEECHGSGKERSTYNPDSKWDWYVEGGRFADNHIPEGGSPVRAILAAWTPKSAPFAIVTPDGAWHERAKMGWWAMTRDEMPLNEWRAKAKAILADYAEGHVVVGLDCHI